MFGLILYQPLLIYLDFVFLLVLALLMDQLVRFAIFVAYLLLLYSILHESLSQSRFAIIGKQFMTKLNNSIQHYEPEIIHYNQRQLHPLTNGQHYPILLENQTRYVGEDARFVCEDTVLGYNTSVPHINQVLWYKDGKLLKPSDRHRIRWSFNPVNQSEVQAGENKRFKIISVLEIMLIQDEDYGVYNCHVSKRTDYHIVPNRQPNDQGGTKKRPKCTFKKRPKTSNKCYCKCSFSPSERKWKISFEEMEHMFFRYNGMVWTAEFRLIKEKTKNMTIFVAPGTFVSVGTYYRHLGMKDDISMRYTIKGVAPTNKILGCSIFVLLYFIFIKGGKINSLLSVINLYELLVFNLNVTDPYENQWKSKFSVMNQCISPNLYGKHDIVITRSYFNESDNATSDYEYSFPIKLDFKPQISNLFDFYGADQSSQIFDLDCWFSGVQNTSAICRTVYTLIETLADNVKYLDYFFFGITMVVLLILSLFIHTAYKIILCILNPVRKVVPIENFADIPIETCIKYHAYLSYSESDRVFVREKLFPIMKQMDMTYFDPNTNITPGTPVNPNLGTAITQSSLFIVVASNEYTQNIALNEFEMNLILHKAKPNKLLIIKKDECHISDIFGEIYKLLNWTNEKSDKKYQALFTEWVYSNLPVQPNYYFETVVCFIMISVIVFVKFDLYSYLN
ncbi:uncharacterized protein LOC126831783 [Patella vulgata]|uniref:uncharacterized protein LOC126831783 n=1 Tax=Patella vulgata TaxID=6465 RepID=UPI0024A7F696|nr:uncharacterized protein LOC126831783 [Patella vulgata]